jgi:hypothetical protein
MPGSKPRGLLQLRRPAKAVSDFTHQAEKTTCGPYTIHENMRTCNPSSLAQVGLHKLELLRVYASSSETKL